MSRNVFSPDAWTRARNRFVEDLSEEEKKTFFQASAESILYDASATDKIHEGESTSRKVLAKVQPFIEAVQQYGHALDVYSSTYPLVMGPLWGSIRVVLQVRGHANDLDAFARGTISIGCDSWWHWYGIAV